MWQNGDFDYDGRVTSRAYAILRRNFGGTMPAGAPLADATPQVVPEPVWGLAVPALLLTLRRRRRGSVR